MFKSLIALILILFFVCASNGQTPQTAQDYLKSGMAHFQKGETDAALADTNKALEWRTELTVNQQRSTLHSQGRVSSQDR